MKPPTIVFIHGNSMGSWSFRNQLCAPELSDFRMHALDLPGSASGKRLGGSQEYLLSKMANRLVDEINDLELDHLVLVGHSYGGHLIMQGLSRFLNLSGVVILGAPPLRSLDDATNAFKSIPELEIPNKAKISDEEAESWSDAMIHNKLLLPEIKDSILRTDPDFRKGIELSFLQKDYRDDFEMIFWLSFPVMIVTGENDKFICEKYLATFASDLSWKKKIHVIQGGSHFPQLELPAEFNSLLLRYLSDLQIHKTSGY